VTSKKVPMVVRSLSLLVLASVLVAPGARADSKAACLDASSKGQRLRGDHKLVEAREQLRVCAAAVCPAVVQSDCAAWLAEVERALPTVVVTAKNPAGADRVDVAVSVDGQPLVSKLDGQAVPLNAGLHAFHFQSADGASLDQAIMIREGEQNQSVAVGVGAPLPSGPPTSAAAAAGMAPDGAGGARAEGAPAPSSYVRTAGWVIGGVGVAALGVATVFGIVTLSDKSAAHCDANNVCDPGTTSGIKSAARVSDVGWFAGGVLLAGGAALVIFGPKESPKAAVRIAPTLLANGGGAVVAGTW
jgi:hypothetical protein